MKIENTIMWTISKVSEKKKKYYGLHLNVICNVIRNVLKNILM